MNFLFVNTYELSALPLCQRITYLMGIRPYMDRKTCIVGIKRRISYQSLREILYVAPIAGVKTGAPSQQQVRLAVKALERAGLVAIQSTEKHLILKCLLAETHDSAQNKADMKTTPEDERNRTYSNPLASYHAEHAPQKVDTIKNHQADTPHNSVINNVCLVMLSQKFEQFWSIYPKPYNKTKTWEVFKRLNPNDELFDDMMRALHEQIYCYREHQQLGFWAPHWRYPANWLIQEGWKDELINYLKTNINNKEQIENYNYAE